eukprot:TRINITY_DN781_c1_g1_i1.p1 TRINITY_DN781_c1_g1~~TRINITY_DN781_c1_g1_i1.p1  ORF type:complete len:428 (+),score=55.24 TRINITY_DN781_c1_g1_i1:79-1362(+)
MFLRHRQVRCCRFISQQMSGYVRKWVVDFRIGSDGKLVHKVTDNTSKVVDGGSEAVVPVLKYLPSPVTSWIDRHIAQHLLPAGYQHGSVHKSYFRYVGYHSIAAVAGAVVMVFSTQSMLYAAGLGAGAIPVAAALSWVLKDGLGQLGGVLFASFVNKNFDADPKRHRFLAGLTLDLAAALETLTLFFPKFFLPLAAAANCGKNVSFLAASASRASIHNTLASSGNLADITAKAGSQTTVAAAIGTTFGALISTQIGSDPTCMAVAVGCGTVVHLSCLYMCVRAVAFSQLNQQRLELLIDEWHRTKKVLTPCEVSKIEHFATKYTPRVIIGPDLRNVLTTSGGYNTLLRELSKSNYFIVSCNGGIGLLLSSSAETGDIIKGLFHSMTGSKKNAELFIDSLQEAGWDLSQSYIEDQQARVVVHKDADSC